MARYTKRAHTKRFTAGVGMRLRNLRENLDWSQRKAGEMSGINYSTIACIENERSTPRYSSIQRLAIAYECKLSDIFGEKG